MRPAASVQFLVQQHSWKPKLCGYTSGCESWLFAWLAAWASSNYMSVWVWCWVLVSLSVELRGASRASQFCCMDWVRSNMSDALCSTWATGSTQMGSQYHQTFYIAVTIITPLGISGQVGRVSPRGYPNHPKPLPVNPVCGHLLHWWDEEAHMVPQGMTSYLIFSWVKSCPFWLTDPGEIPADDKGC